MSFEIHKVMSRCCPVGVSGAGRVPSESKLFCELTEGMHAYGVAHHRHMPEIEQGLSDGAGENLICQFDFNFMNIPWYYCF